MMRSPLTKVPFVEQIAKYPAAGVPLEAQVQPRSAVVSSLRLTSASLARPSVSRSFGAQNENSGPYRPVLDFHVRLQRSSRCRIDGPSEPIVPGRPRSADGKDPTGEWDAAVRSAAGAPRTTLDSWQLDPHSASLSTPRRHMIGCRYNISSVWPAQPSACWGHSSTASRHAGSP